MNNKVPDYRENKSTGFMLAARYISLKGYINFTLLQAYTNLLRTFHLKIYSNCLPLYLNDVINISCDIQKKFVAHLVFLFAQPWCLQLPLFHFPFIYFCFYF